MPVKQLYTSHGQQALATCRAVDSVPQKLSIEHPAYVFLILLLATFFFTGTVLADYYPGYTFYTPLGSTHSYLLNQQNETVHSWSHNTSGGYAIYMLENGHILRTAQVNNGTFGGGGGQGKVQEYDWDSNLIWEFTYSSNEVYSHHDIEPMPNGNVLMIAWEFKSSTEAQQAGYSGFSSLWPDHIIEVEPSGNNSGTIVWEWHAWDHLIQDYNSGRDNYGVVGDHPELLDINMGGGGGGPGGGDWMHMNGISYNPDLDQIVFSSHHFDEIYVIDHSTTTAEAAGHTGGLSGKGGDILYRWGKPANYDAPGTAVFDVVHCSIWIPAGYPGAGNLMAFNNRDGTGASQIVEIIPPLDADNQYILNPGQAYGPDEPVWDYMAAGFYSNHLGGVSRLPNGNTLICESTSGYIFEVDSDGTTQWSYDYGSQTVRAWRYGTEYPGVYALNSLADGAVVLNEILLNNATTQADQDGEYDPWVELYNTTDEEISLWGFSLTTDAADPAMWTFPDTTIAANSFLVVWLDGDEDQDGLHSSFEAQTEGSMFMFTPVETQFDAIASHFDVADISYGRYPDGSDEFILMFPTFGAPNDGSDVPVDIEDYQLPEQTKLTACYPNPFNSTITISYQLAARGKVRVDVYNTLGQPVAGLVNGMQYAGEHETVWRGTNRAGQVMASGVYLVTFNSGDVQSTRKIVLMK